MVRFLVSLALASAVIAPGCTSTQAPIARRVGMVTSIGGVVGLIASTAATAFADTGVAVGVFSAVSAFGIGLYAAGELTDPAFAGEVETKAERHARWARILTERAFRYAREGNCARVRRVEKRVNFYDRAFHDGVFMRDEAIAKCMSHVVDPPANPDAPSESDSSLPTLTPPAPYRVRPSDNSNSLD